MSDNRPTVFEGHLSDDIIKKLAAGEMTDAADTLLLLEHLNACPACMDRYIAAVCEMPPEEAPSDEGWEAVVARVEAAIVRQSEEDARQEAAKRQQVIIIGAAKLLVALAMTFLLFFSGVFTAIGKYSGLLFEKMDSRIETILTEQDAEDTQKPDDETDEDKDSWTWEGFALGIQDGFGKFCDRIHMYFVGDEEV